MYGCGHACLFISHELECRSYLYALGIIIKHGIATNEFYEIAHFRFYPWPPLGPTGIVVVFVRSTELLHDRLGPGLRDDINALIL